MIRTFKSGANRNADNGKLEIYGFNHPLVDTSFNKYMHHHRKLEDGTLRDSDNWWKGFPTRVIIESLSRHIHDIKMIYAGYKVTENGNEVNLEEAINGAKFNLNALQLDNLKDTKVIERNEK
jgi:hypothetical protein